MYIYIYIYTYCIGLMQSKVGKKAGQSVHGACHCLLIPCHCRVWTASSATWSTRLGGVGALSATPCIKYTYSTGLFN